MIVGITGGIGSGKSTLSEKLRTAGYAVFDSDSVARKLQNENAEMRQQIMALFGTDAYRNNELDRKHISGIVFKNQELLQQLNQIVHPAVRANFLEWKQKHSHHNLLFLESALLLESNFYNLVHKIILVTAPLPVRVQRVMLRDNISEQQVLDRIKNQLSDNEMASKSHVIIDSGLIDLRELDVQLVLSQLL